ncbi:MAG TPA: hypothetical protein VND45_11585 [Thermoanaerobaculia bacterium]|nr:hypothetical protein [Thermoanaerobaculia bacterium]
MKRVVRPLLGAVMFVCFASSLWAESLAFVRGMDGALWVRDRQTWTSLGGQLLGSPDACSWGGDRIDVFARGMNRNLVQISRIGGRWTSWVDHGGTLATDPSCVSWGANRIDVFSSAAAGNVIQKSWTGSEWTDWRSLGGEVTDPVDAASWGPGRIDVFVRGTDDALWQIAFDDGHWGGWTKLGGRIISSPGAVSWGPNRIDVFARGRDGTIRQIAWDGERWTPWTDQGGQEFWSGFGGGPGPDVTSLGPNRLELYVVGAAQDVQRKTWNGTRWSGWQSLGGKVNGEIGAVALRAVRSVPDAPRSARFRITLDSFRVNRASWDDILSRDGKGDEVFFVYEARVLGKEGEVRAATGLVRTPVYGDVNHEDWRTTRRRSGSWSDLGGLKSGDGDALNITVWEGTLEAGGDSVLVIPTVWEWDGNQDFLNSVFRFLATPVALAGEGIGLAVNARTASTLDAAAIAYTPVLKILSGRGEIGSDVVASKSIFGDPKDRPIGMADADAVYRFNPQAIQLTYETAVQITTFPPTQVRDSVGARIPVRYIDAEELKGDYTLYVTVERIER